MSSQENFRSKKCNKGSECPYAKGEIKGNNGKVVSCSFFHPTHEIKCFKEENCPHHKNGKCKYYHSSSIERVSRSSHPRAPRSNHVSKSSLQEMEEELKRLQIEEARERLKQAKAQTEHSMFLLNHATTQLADDRSVLSSIHKEEGFCSEDDVSITSNNE